MSFSMSTSQQARRAEVILIGVLVISLAVATWIAPPHAVVLHNILHHLNILPFILAGMFFGWRGALITVVFAAVLQAPSIYRHWFRAPFDAKDQIVELSTFGIAGVIVGVLADRERMQRRRVEITKLELEHVHEELRQNIHQLKKTERLTAAGQLSASLAHEIRNPLASISGAAGILARGQASTESQAECLDILTKESLRLNKLLTNFLNFARPRLPRYQKVEPIGMVQSVKALVQHEAVKQGVHLLLEAPEKTPEIECDPEQIKQLLLNLILNAIQASNHGDPVVIRAFHANDLFYIEVLDRGKGISQEEKERIFDPFFTTKENGTGLGLAIAANIASQHGGFLACQTSERKETVFRVTLPCSAPVVSRKTMAVSP